MKYMKYLLLFSYIAVSSAVAADEIICKEFSPKISKLGKIVEFSLNTDLPENTQVSVTISRDYKEKGKSENYSLAYYEFRGTISDLKEKRSADISTAVWDEKMGKKIDLMASLGADLAFTLGKISDYIAISMVVPVNQSNKEFEKMNKNLK